MEKKVLKMWHALIALALLTMTLAGCGGGGAAAVTRISAPTGVAVTASTAQATVTWNAVSGAASYNVYYGTSAGVTKATAAASVTGITATSATVTSMVNGSADYFVVTAVNADGESIESAEVSATPISNPQGIVASAENGQATIAWLASSGATSYNVYYGTTNPVTTSNALNKIAVTGPATGTSNGSSYYTLTVPSLTNGTTYYFAVTAVAGANSESILSSQKSAQPKSASAKPGSPAAVTVTSTAAGTAHVVWGDYVPDATSYNVYYSTSSSLTIGPTTNGTKVSYTASGQDITGLTSGTTYYFLVTAVNAAAVESGAQTNAKNVVIQ